MKWHPEGICRFSFKVSSNKPTNSLTAALNLGMGPVRVHILACVSSQLAYDADSFQAKLPAQEQICSLLQGERQSEIWEEA